MKKSLHLLVAILLGSGLPAFSQNKTELPPETSKQQSPQKPGSETAAAQPKIFTFEGGSLREFISAFKRQLGTDLYDIASIDPKALNMQVPKMKIPLGANSWEMVLNTYNHLSASTELSLGSWVIVRAVGAANDRTPNAVIFMPPKNLAEEAPLKVKAFSLERLADNNQFGILQSLIEEESHLLRDASERSGKPGNFAGELRYHSGTGLLIASGGQEYVELAGTIIEAYREAVANRRIADPE